MMRIRIRFCVFACVPAVLCPFNAELCCNALAGGLLEQWVFNSQLREAAKIAIGTQKLRDAVVHAESSDTGVMHRAADEICFAQDRFPHWEESFPLAQQNQHGGFQPAADLDERILDRSRRAVDARMSNNRHKFIQAGPGDGPLRGSFSELREEAIRLEMPWGIGAMGIHKNVSVNGDQFSACPVDQITYPLPIAFGDTRLQSLSFKGVALQSESARGFSLG